MESKYNAIVYEGDMNDILKKANVIGTYSGMRADSEGRYSDMDFYQLGFDYPTWRELRDNKIDIEYIDDLGNLYSLVKGRCNNMNSTAKMKDVIAEEIAKGQAIKEQIALKEKYVDASENGITEYKEKKTSVVPNKKAMSLVATDKDSDLVLPFREIKQGSSDKMPILIYLHDKKSRGSNNSTLLLKECKLFLQAMKSITEDYILIIPNAVTAYGIKYKDEFGKNAQKKNSLNKLLDKIIKYEISENNGDKNRVYIMGVGSGAEDAMSELNTNSDTYAAAVVAFGVGWYKNIDGYKDITFEVASASDDMDYADEDIAYLVEDLKELGAVVNYNELEGNVATAGKQFYKDITWLKNIFAVTRKAKSANENA